MIREAQEHAAEDRKKKETAEARNELEASSYQLGKALESAQGLPENDAARARTLIDEAKTILKNDAATIEQIRVAISDVKQMLQIVTSRPAASGADASQGSGSDSRKQDDNVVDAEFVDQGGAQS